MKSTGFAKPKVLVVGSSNSDLIIRLERLPKPGETILGGELITAAGGKGANQAVAAARAGGDVTFVARVGRDAWGQQAIAGLRRDHIHVQFVRRDLGAPSGVALVFVAKDGANSIAVAAGANGRLSPADVRKAKGAVRRCSSVVIQLETPLETVKAAADMAARAHVPVILNPAPACVLSDELLALVSILTPNETEAELLTGIAVTSPKTAARAAEKLLARGVETVIVTLGARGAFVATSSIRELVPAFQVKAVDTTAAGDVFNAALAVALGEGRLLLEAVRFAHAAAAISVTRRGAQPSAPTRKEIERLLKRVSAPLSGAR